MAGPQESSSGAVDTRREDALLSGMKWKLIPGIQTKMIGLDDRGQQVST